MNVVDIAFPVYGTAVPADHGYLLFSALCELVPHLAQDSGWALHPIRGHEEHGRLYLVPFPELRLRLPASDVGDVLVLSGRELRIGADTIRVGVGTVRPLVATTCLESTAVYIPGATPSTFAAAVEIELSWRGLRRSGTTVEVGKPRELRTRTHAVRCCPVRVSGLRPEASLKLQAHGLGARRHMGAGVFLPAGGK